MTHNIDVYWSFRSPYSYLAMRQLKNIRSLYKVDIQIKPVYPLAVRDVAFFKNRRPQLVGYMAADMMREAQRHNISLRWPQPDPIVQDMSTMSVAKEQPLIDRLMLLGASAQREKGVAAFDFFDEVSQIIFDGNTDNWHEGHHLSLAAERAGFSLETLEKSVKKDANELLKLIEHNEEAQQKYHWGVPLMVFNNEPFFGQDRIPTLTWRLEQTLNT